MLSQYTTYLAESLCGGSSRKLIAGWWYSILGLTLVLMLMSFLVIGGNRPISEGFASFWSGVMLVALSIGGTMIMRKFHNSMAVGFFMGTVVATSQLFFLLSLLYMGYRHDVKSSSGSAGVEELWLAFFALLQSLLLGSFAAILAAHRSEILDKPGSAVMEMMDEMHGINTTKKGGRHHMISDTYEPVTIPPSPTTGGGLATSPSATLSTNGSSSIQHDMG